MLFAILTTVVSTLVAQERTGLDLAEVVRVTLANNPDILLARQDAEGSRGNRIAAAAPFDPFLQAGTGFSRRRVVDPTDAALSEVSQSLSLRRLFRNGLVLGSDVSASRLDLSTPGADTVNDLSSSLTVAAPLLRDRGGAASVAPERAADYNYQASRWAERQAIALLVLTAAVSYWDYVEASQRFDVFVEAEQRAQQSAEQTRALVAADERTSADLIQMQGNLAAKRATRIAAEQSVIDTWQPLGLAMGLPPESIIARQVPATPFPAALDEGAARRTAMQLLEAAYARRPDLTAAETSLRAAEAVLDGARNQIKPRLDLIFGTGYRARALGQGLGAFFEPFRAENPKHLDASVRLNYEFATTNSAARGQLLQASSAFTREQILVMDLRRRIAVGVTVAAEALTRGEAGMKASEEAVQLLGQAVQAEQRKFQVGMSTLFDVIQAQDALTNALLGRIGSQRNYAVALATLRYQSGTLLDAGDTSPVVATSALLTPP